MSEYKKQASDWEDLYANFFFLQNLLRRCVAFMYIVCPPFLVENCLALINTGTSLNFSLVRFHITVDCDIHSRFVPTL